jgi:hypothetical protein
LVGLGHWIGLRRRVAQLAFLAGDHLAGRRSKIIFDALPLCGNPQEYLKSKETIFLSFFWP